LGNIKTEGSVEKTELGGHWTVILVTLALPEL
jgi:hypothetical protein